MRLPELQRLCLARFTACDVSPKHILEDQIDGGAIGKTTRIAVYVNNFAAIVAGALRNVFPTVEQLVGDACFRGLAQRYSREHASVSGDLQAYGHAFPAMLGQIYGAGEYAFIADIAQLEFALDECLAAADSPSMTGEQLQRALSEETDIPLSPHPSLHLVESSFPIVTLWRAHRDGELASLSIEAPAQNVVVVRAGSDAQMTVVSPFAMRLIQALISDGPLDAALSGLGSADTERLTRALREIIASRALLADHSSGG